MISLATILASATFFINSENRHFMHRWVVTPAAHATVKIECVIRKPFHKRKP